MNTYTTVAGDTWDIVSLAVYGSELHADYLMEHNYRNLDYFIFPAGIILDIPELPEEAEEEYPPWRDD